MGQDSGRRVSIPACLSAQESWRKAINPVREGTISSFSSTPEHVFWNLKACQSLQPTSLAGPNAGFPGCGSFSEPPPGAQKETAAVN